MQMQVWNCFSLLILLVLFLQRKIFSKIHHNEVFVPRKTYRFKQSPWKIASWLWFEKRKILEQHYRHEFESSSWCSKSWIARSKLKEKKKISWQSIEFAIAAIKKVLCQFECKYQRQSVWPLSIKDNWWIQRSKFQACFQICFFCSSTIIQWIFISSQKAVS